MKKIYTKLLLIAALSFSVFAAEAKIINLGVAAGTTISNYSLEGLKDAVNNNAGFQVGVMAEFALPIMSITPEVWYVQNSFSVADSENVKVKSIELPVVAGITLLKFLTLEAGPRFVLYDDAKGGGYDFDSITSSVGYVAGAKLTLFKKVIIGARYNGEFGTSSIDALDSAIKCENMTLMVGYKF